jgi:hypothetical protein
MAIISEAIKLLGRTGKETLKQQFFLDNCILCDVHKRDCR